MKIQDVRAMAMEAASRGWIGPHEVWAVACKWAAQQGTKLDAHEVFARILDTEKLKTLSTAGMAADTMASDFAGSLPPPTRVRTLARRHPSRREAGEHPPRRLRRGLPRRLGHRAGRSGEHAPAPQRGIPLGVVLYKMLAGVAPFEGRIAPEIMLRTCTMDPRPPREIVPGTPLLLEDLCLQMLAKESRSESRIFSKARRSASGAARRHARCAAARARSSCAL